MRHRPVLFAAALTLAAAQPASEVRAAPPDRAALERLNLRNEWTAYLPLDGRKDGVEIVQVVDDTQIFVQTRSGLLVALDANSGARQWTYRYSTAYTALFPVAVTEQFVFALNVSRLYCIHRYTGVLEFNYELPGYATTGPAADRELVYLTLNGDKVLAFRFPTLIRTTARGQDDPRQQEGEPVNPADALAERYTLGAVRSMIVDPEFDRPYVFLGPGEPLAGVTGVQRTPSLSVLPSVVPPYTLANRRLYATPALDILPSLRQPYQLKPDYMQFNQRTPSVSVIPPSIARVHELANLRPKGVQPTQEWAYRAPARLQFSPLRVSGTIEDPTQPPSLLNRLWLTYDGPLGSAVSAADGRPQVRAEFTAPVTAPIGGPLVYARADGQPGDPATRTQLGFIALGDGALLAVDLLGGSMVGPRVEWRANLGGFLNRKPLATTTSVFAAGEHAGVSNVDVRTGDLIWRTEQNADQVLAVNDEFAYVLDRVGNLQVYDRRRPSDPVTRRANPLAQLHLPGFNVPVTNHQTDRILLADDNGIMICLRDASAKYVRPQRVAAPPPAPPKEEPKAQGEPGDAKEGK
jgi:outer membrane protein assembly factor BamB